VSLPPSSPGDDAHIPARRGHRGPLKVLPKCDDLVPHVIRESPIIEWVTDTFMDRDDDNLPAKPLVIGISSRALLDLEQEDKIFKIQGTQAFIDYQREHRNELIPKGVAFPLIKALVDLNKSLASGAAAAIEVVVISRNHPDCGFRIQNSLEKYGLQIPKAAFTGGTSVIRELVMFNVDLFLSYEESDVVAANKAGVSAAKIFGGPADPVFPEGDVPLFAFDGDSTLFSDEGDRAFQRGGLVEFARLEIENLETPLKPGPMYGFAKALGRLQQLTPIDRPQFRIALVTARNFYFMRRPIDTLHSWGIRLDKAYAVGNMNKGAVLRELGALMFFDDSAKHCTDVSSCAPAALIPSTIPPLQIGASVVTSPQDRLIRFTKICKLVLRKDFEAEHKTLLECFEGRITALPEKVFELKMAEFERSVSGTPKGQFVKERQAAGPENSRAAKLKMFLNSLLDMSEVSETAESDLGVS
jgi:5'-nucleotidase